MPLTTKQKLSIIPFLLYWPILFTLMHIPIPSSGNWQITINLSDKILHCFAYLILLFVVWFALKQDAKVIWRKSLPWLIILGMAIYGIFDEWLQGYVGRSPDITDFAADMISVILGLLVLTFIPFWPASLAITCIVTFILTQFLKANFSINLPIILTIFYILLYGFITLLWIRCLNKKTMTRRSLAAAFLGPFAFLLIMETFFKLSINDFSWLNVIFAILAIVFVIKIHKLFTSR